MSEKNWEYTGETREGRNGKEVREIRWISGPYAGAADGWIEHDRNIFGSGIVAYGGVVTDRAVVADGGRVEDFAWLAGNARVVDSRVANRAVVKDSALIRDSSIIVGVDVVVGGSAYLRNARVVGEAEILTTEHYLQVGPMGSEQVFAHLYRTANDYHFNVGCWMGRIEELAAEVEQRRESAYYWREEGSTEAQRKQWVKEYKALAKLAKARAKSFHA
ncbi:hypothetical protein GS982_01890 [Rhodococcus hoagii]|uniref:Uncharacterized protein n=1 Tax=Rhodococcus hoagii TaxID=43767 RepID=A0A9Q4ZIP3_RHOHA|nr:hypothetical protein [Prescottella equi]NKT77349.1 hypothetical protein [Prescottella equi]NKZ81134.1 hypothetical protein [Prescottella equi]